jgi:hypothetical protein
MNSAYDQMIEMAAGLSFAEKLRFNADFAALIKKDAKAGSVGKAVKKDKKEKDAESDKPKRGAGVGQLAWFAFVKHCKATMADRFTECSKEPERLTVVKAIKAEDGAAYEAFVAQFKAESASASAAASEDEGASGSGSAPAAPAAPSAPSVPVPSKVEALKAAMAAKKAAKAEAKPEAKEPKAKKEPKEPKAKKEPKEPKAKKSAGGGGGGPGPAPSAVAEQLPMPIKVIGGKRYFWDTDNNGLMTVEDDDSFGGWVGFFQPTNEAEPIRYTDGPDCE